MSPPLVRSSSSSSGSPQESRDTHTSSSSNSSMPLDGFKSLGNRNSPNSSASSFSTPSSSLSSSISSLPSSLPSSPEPASVSPPRRPIPKRYLPRPRLVPAKPTPRAPKRSLLDLPVETILTIAHAAATDRDFHALSKTCRALYALLHEDLYLLNAMHHHASALKWAARTGNTARAAHILDLERVESTATFDVWRESLHLAARGGHREIVRLLRREEPVACELARPRGECRFKPLTYAAGGRQTEMLRFLLATLPRFDRRDACHALQYAEFLGEEEAAGLLRRALRSPAPAADASCAPHVGEMKKRGGPILVSDY